MTFSAAYHWEPLSWRNIPITLFDGEPVRHDQKACPLCAERTEKTARGGRRTILLRELRSDDKQIAHLRPLRHEKSVARQEGRGLQRMWCALRSIVGDKSPYHSLTSKKAHDRDVLIGSDLKCSVLRMDGFYGTIPMADAAIATQGPNPKYVVYELPLRWHSKKRGRSNKKAAEI
jgi:hypothetical protein